MSLTILTIQAEALTIAIVIQVETTTAVEAIIVALLMKVTEALTVDKTVLTNEKI
jgi:hypothetical protein